MVLRRRRAARRLNGGGSNSEAACAPWPASQPFTQACSARAMAQMKSCQLARHHGSRQRHPACPPGTAPDRACRSARLRLPCDLSHRLGCGRNLGQLVAAHPRRISIAPGALDRMRTATSCPSSVITRRRTRSPRWSARRAPGRARPSARAVSGTATDRQSLPTASSRR